MNDEVGALMDSPPSEGDQTPENQSDQPTGSEPEKTQADKEVPFHKHPRWQEMMLARDEDRKKIESLEAQLAGRDGKKQTGLSSEGERFVEEIRNQVIDHFEGLVQKQQEEATTRSAEAQRRADEIRSELGEDFSDFQEFLKERVKTYPGASIDQFLADFEQTRKVTKKNVADPGKSVSEVATKVLKIDRNEDFYSAARRARESI